MSEAEPVGMTSKQLAFRRLLEGTVYAFFLLVIIDLLVVLCSPRVLRWSHALLLNTYAWNLVASEEAEERQARRALPYALKAVSLTEERDPMILDTLAWTYFRLGQQQKALYFEKRAIELSPKNTIYTKHLRRILTVHSEERPDSFPDGN